MPEFFTFQSFLMWATSAVGLGIIVPFLVGVIKNYVRLEGMAAIGVTLGVSVVVAICGTLLLEYQIYTYIEQYWFLILAVIGVTFGSSQAVYHLAPRTSNRDA